MKKKNHSELSQPLHATHKLSPRVYYKLGEAFCILGSQFVTALLFSLLGLWSHKKLCPGQGICWHSPPAPLGLWARYGAKEGSWKQSFRKHRGCQRTAFLKLFCVILWASASDVSSLRMLSTTFSHQWSCGNTEILAVVIVVLTETNPSCVGAVIWAENWWALCPEVTVWRSRVHRR